MHRDENASSRAKEPKLSHLDITKLCPLLGMLLRTIEIFVTVPECIHVKF